MDDGFLNSLRSKCSAGGLDSWTRNSVDLISPPLTYVACFYIGVGRNYVYDSV